MRMSDWGSDVCSSDLRRPVPLACPDCASLALQPQGIGTERIEELLARRFDHVPVLRIDRGSTRRQGALEKQFDSLGAGAGVLSGTQKIGRGSGGERVWPLVTNLVVSFNFTTKNK